MYIDLQKSEKEETINNAFHYLNSKKLFKSSESSFSLIKNIIPEKLDVFKLISDLDNFRVVKSTEIPILEEINKTVKFRNNNNFLYHFVINHENIDSKYLIEKEIGGDGNCFFRNLSYYYTNLEKYHLFFRELLYNYIIDNQTNVIKDFPQIVIKEKIVNTKDYIPNIAIAGNYANGFEIGNIVKILNLNIAVYTKEFYNNNNNFYYKFHSYFNIEDTEYKRNLMLILYNPNNEHYIHIYYNKNNANFNTNNKIIKSTTNDNINNIKNSNISNNKIMNDLESDIKNLIKKYANLSISNKYININDKLSNSYFKLDFKDKLKLGYNYPIYPNNKYGDKLLIYIREYLISRKNSFRNPKYPDYIYENNEKIENNKRYFRMIAKHYEIDNYNNLYIKYFYDKNNKDEYTLKSVPFTSNLSDFLLKIHKEDCHRSALSLRKNLLNRNIYYYGIIADTNNIVKNCPICKIKINIFNYYFFIIYSY